MYCVVPNLLPGAMTGLAGKTEHERSQISISTWYLSTRSTSRDSFPDVVEAHCTILVMGKLKEQLPVYLANLRMCRHEIDELCICLVALTHGPTLHCSIFIHDTGQTTGKHIWRFWVWESWHWPPTIAVDYPLAASCSQLAPGTPVVTSALMEAWKYIPTWIAPILTLTVDICRTELYIYNISYHVTCMHRNTQDFPSTQPLFPFGFIFEWKSEWKWALVGGYIKAVLMQSSNCFPSS